MEVRGAGTRVAATCTCDDVGGGAAHQRCGGRLGTHILLPGQNRRICQRHGVWRTAASPLRCGGGTACRSRPCQTVGGSNQDMDCVLTSLQTAEKLVWGQKRFFWIFTSCTLIYNTHNDQTLFQICSSSSVQSRSSLRSACEHARMLRSSGIVSAQMVAQNSDMRISLAPVSASG